MKVGNVVLAGQLSGDFDISRQQCRVHRSRFVVAVGQLVQDDAEACQTDQFPDRIVQICHTALPSMPC